MSKKELGEVATALFKAKHKIEKEENWCQASFQRISEKQRAVLGFNDYVARIAEVNNPNFCDQWCSIGSIRVDTNMWGPLSLKMIGYLAKAAKELDPGLRPMVIHDDPRVPDAAHLLDMVYAFNDLKSHAEVMKMWDRAIEMAIGDRA